MKIGGFQKFSMVDFPGHLCATVFTSGCNFRCPYCHNPELVLPELFGKSIPVSDILGFLSTRVGKLDGVTITGGEPTLHPDLPDLIEKIRNLGFLVKLDTNGTNPDMLADLIARHLVDYIAMDYKGPLAKYDIVSGVRSDKEKIIRSLQILKNSGIRCEFRTTAVRELLTPEDISQMSEELGAVRKHYIQQFNGTKTLDKSYRDAVSVTQSDIQPDSGVIFR